jgi:hypothetical protein
LASSAYFTGVVLGNCVALLMVLARKKRRGVGLGR